MQFGRHRFSPPWWSFIFLVVGVAALSSLGIWQIQRAHYKEHLIAQHQAAKAAGPQKMAITHADAPPRRGYHYIAQGHYDARHQILLADQMKDTRNGYRVWTPFILDSGVQIMVDRGWVPKPTQAGAPPPNPKAPEGEIKIRGYWRSLPQPGLRFSHQAQCGKKGWPRSFDFPSKATVRCQYSRPVAGGLMLLNADQKGGFVRDWHEDSIGLPPWQHYLYAAQWFFGVLLVIGLFIFLGARHKTPKEPEHSHLT